MHITWRICGAFGLTHRERTVDPGHRTGEQAGELPLPDGSTSGAPVCVDTSPILLATIAGTWAPLFRLTRVSALHTSPDLLTCDLGSPLSERSRMAPPSICLDMFDRG